MSASGETRVSMLREGEGFDRTWTLEAPRTHPADSEQVEDYLRNWEFAIPVRTLESPSDEDLKQFGLDAPKGEVTLEMGRAEVVVTLGASFSARTSARTRTTPYEPSSGKVTPRAAESRRSPRSSGATAVGSVPSMRRRTCPVTTTS